MAHRLSAQALHRLDSHLPATSHQHQPVSRMPSDQPKHVVLHDRQGSGLRVLLVRLSAIGDCVQTMPLACALRQQWPDCHLTWAVEPAAVELVQANIAVNSVVVVPKRFAKSPWLLWQLRKTLRPLRFDVALDPQGLTKSGLVAWLSGASRRIGFARPAARELNPWFQTDLVASRREHRVDRYLELLQPFGSREFDVHAGLRIPDSAQGPLQHLRNTANLAAGFVAINPGAGWDSKRWPVENYAAVARSLSARNVQCIVTWGGHKELAWAEAIVHLSRGAAILAPPTSLLELAAILQHSQLFIGSDTGPLHLAAAVGARCVALFGSSQARACGPYGPGHISLQEAFDDAPGRKRQGADNWAMRRITPAMVLEACDRVLALPHRLVA